MSKIFITISFLFLTFHIDAQIKAVTETGDEVLLFENNTWSYVNKSNPSNTEISKNPAVFKKDKNASFQIKSTNVDLGIWINPKKWSFTKGGSGDESEYDFQLKGEDLYAMFITEKFEIPLVTLKDIAIENAREVAPDIALDKEEYRSVNGLEVLLLQMSGTIQGIKFTYYGYYYSNASGSAQFITYTAPNLLEYYKKDIENLLNGLVEVKN